MTGGQALLALVVAAPLLGVVAVLAVRRTPGAPAAAALAAAGTSVAAALGLLVVVPPWERAGDSVRIDLPWADLLGSRLRLGWDGISAPLVVLTTVLVVLCVLHLRWSGDGRDPVDAEGTDSARAGAHPALLACLLVVGAGAVATFLARDLIVFFVAFETVLVPMWFVVARFGDPTGRPGERDGAAARSAAATRFVLFTAAGSAVMLVGILLLAVRAGTTDLVELARVAPVLDGGTQAAVAAFLIVGLGVKVPVWPLHSWLPPAHTIAPTVGSVLLAGVLLKLGSYGLVRLVAGLVPDGLARWAVPLAAVGAVGVLWGGLVCLVERDLKRLVAFSSVAHMGFVALGVASGTPEGLQGALFVGVAHGVVTGLLFFVVGMLKHRTHTADLHLLGPGLRDRSPRLGWVLALGAVAGLGLPGLAGFWGEVLALIGVWRGDALLGRAGAVGFTVAAALGTALAAAYLLRVLYLVWHGPSRPEVAEPATGSVERVGAHQAAGQRAPAAGEAVAVSEVADLGAGEQVVLAPLVVASVALGVLPWLLLSLTGPAVRLLLQAGAG